MYSRTSSLNLWNKIIFRARNILFNKQNQLKVVIDYAMFGKENVVANDYIYGGFTNITHIVAITLASVKFLFQLNHLEFCGFFQESCAKDFYLKEQ